MKCLKVFDQEVVYTEAKQICQSNGATINSIHSTEENEFIVNFIKTFDPSVRAFWIGATKRQSETDVFEWDNGNSFDFTKWHSGRPVSNIGNESFVEILVNENGFWNDVSEDQNIKNRFICETNIIKE